MPFLVNGQIVPELLIREEMDRLSRDPTLKAVTDPAEHARRLRNAAEMSAIDRTMVEQLAMSDPRAIDPANQKREVKLNERLLRFCQEDEARRIAGHELTVGARGAGTFCRSCSENSAR